MAGRLINFIPIVLYGCSTSTGDEVVGCAGHIYFESNANDSSMGTSWGDFSNSFVDDSEVNIYITQYDSNLLLDFSSNVSISFDWENPLSLHATSVGGFPGERDVVRAFLVQVPATLNFGLLELALDGTVLAVPRLGDVPSCVDFSYTVRTFDGYLRNYLADNENYDLSLVVPDDVSFSMYQIYSNNNFSFFFDMYGIDNNNISYKILSGEWSTEQEFWPGQWRLPP